jgi:hypothetical protein
MVTKVLLAGGSGGFAKDVATDCTSKRFGFGCLRNTAYIHDAISDDDGGFGASSGRNRGKARVSRFLWRRECKGLGQDRRPGFSLLLWSRRLVSKPLL